MKIYQVGGAVRDKLLGLQIKDRDWVVVGTTPEEMIKLGYKPVGKDFPVFLHPDTKEEYALARTERKTGKGYTGFSFHASREITLEQDLSRRDLTINAMAEDESGQIIDPFNGREDLQSKTLRHVSPAFMEDPLRVLRVARFAAQLGFTVADETLQLMKNISQSGELLTLPPERIWQEMEQALSAQYPGRFIMVLRASNALAVLFPEIECLFGVPQPKKHHPEIDTGIHTLMSLNQAARLTKDAQVRFAVLVHDLGKCATPEELLPAHRGHESKGVKIIKSLCKRYKIPNQYRDLAVLVSRFHLDCHRIREMQAKTLLKKLEQMDAFRRTTRFDNILLACEADARGRSGMEETAYPQADYLKRALKIAKQVNAEYISRENPDLDGEALGVAIRNNRIQRLKEALLIN